jgi:predicted aldo/keto reductase-like oxidoreductase
MQINRRRFLAATLAGAGSALLDRSPLLAGPARPRSTDPFQMAPLGKTGLRVSLIGAGTGMRGGNRESNQTRLGKEKFEALIRYAYDRGVRFFDCADLYGTHAHVANALKGISRDKYVICTKMWVLPGGLPERERPDANILIDRFRKELDTDYIDLVLIHCMMDANWCERQKRQMDIMEELKEKKIIRAHGASIHSLNALKACVGSPWVECVNARINAFGDAMDNKDPEVVAPVLKQIRGAGKGLVGMKLIGEGRYRNDPQKRDESIRYVLGLGCVDTMIVGFEKPEEIDDFADRVRKALTASRSVRPGREAGARL